ncbi:MAG TPA: NAD(P)-dependent oxidoreductase [Thermoleophilaceae bacterium]|nr:NAD(P)-dependent oxidoreductase [Thermoleophilaceae bacterium]
MRIFVAGATGVIGRALVPLLLEAGHDVVGMTRSSERAAELRDRGVEPAVADAFDVAAVERAVTAARPEVVIHQLTDIPKAIDPRRMETQFALNDRLRHDGTANLLRAAKAAGARRMISQSIAFAYAPGDRLRREEDPLFLDAPQPWRRSVEAVAALEDQTVGAEGLDGIALRYGYFYGPGTSYATDGSTAAMVRKRAFPVVGRGTAVYSFIHVEDAASATVAALDRGTPGVYNVVDDDPAPVSEWLPEYAAALGAKPPRRVPRFAARIAAGRFAVYLMTQLQGATNEKAKRELGWAPSRPSWRHGSGETLG